MGDKSHVSIEITQMHEPLVSSMKQKMEAVTSEGSICLVNSDVMRNCGDLKLYIPDKVSIGPFHHRREQLIPMEDLKLQYLHTLLNRKLNLEATLSKCVDTLKNLEHKARLFYKEEFACPASDEFVEMMLVDGGFILELFLKSSIKGLRRRNDPVFTTPGLLHRVRLDLILLENQIPFFILQELYRIVPIPKQCNLLVTDLALIFFKSMIPGDYQLHKEKYSPESNHLLDFVRHCYLPTIPRNQTTEQTPRRGLPKPAKTLNKSGIKITKARKKDINMLNVKFKNGTLEIPAIHIRHYTETLFRNFIAYEQCKCHVNSQTGSYSEQISSYVLLIRSLINSERDSKFLEDRHVLLIDDNVNEEEGYKLFERLEKCALKFRDDEQLKDFYYDGVCEQVDKYKPLNWWKIKRIKRDVPWSMWVVAVVVLIGVTCFGTIFSILAFFRHH